MIKNTKLISHLSLKISSNSVLAALYSSEGSVMERHHFAQSMCILNTEVSPFVFSILRWGHLTSVLFFVRFPSKKKTIFYQFRDENFDFCSFVHFLTTKTYYSSKTKLKITFNTRVATSLTTWARLTTQDASTSSGGKNIFCPTHDQPIIQPL